MKKTVFFLFISLLTCDAYAGGVVKLHGAIKNKLSDSVLVSYMVDAPGGWHGPVASLYGVQGVPSYFMVGREGKFAVSEVSRPSDSLGLMKQLDKALQ
ncbi:MAG: hypothetical protein H0X33_06900 [Taibaiella sp.]|nr:hypothetical protein [Taibaiella sp.]